MEMKRIITIYICIFFFILQKNIYAMDRKDLIKLTAEIVTLSENKSTKESSKLEKEKIEQNFFDIKEIVQADLKRGDKNASIDIYLFLKGLLKNDITSLQSLISAENMETFSNDLAQLINYSLAQKLSFALKENRIAYKTTIHIKKNPDQKDCKVFWNGKPINSIEPILLPVGIPVYIGLFCPNNLFEVKYIQSAETQSNLTVAFDQLKKIQIQNKNIIPNPNKNSLQVSSLALSKSKDKNQILYMNSKDNSQNVQTKEIENSQVNQTKVIESYQDSQTKSEDMNQVISPKMNNIDGHHEEKAQSTFAIGSGIALIHDYGYLKKLNVSQFGMSKGLFFTWQTFVLFKGFLFLFDYAKVDADDSQSLVFINGQYYGSNSYDNSKIKYNYYKPAIGYHFIIYEKYRNYNITLDILLNHLRVVSAKKDANAHGQGFQFAFGLSKQIISNFNLDFTLGSSYSFGTLGGFQLTTATRLSYCF